MKTITQKNNSVFSEVATESHIDRSANNTDLITQSDLLTVTEAATLLNLKISRIRNLVFLKRIPFIKIGASVRFSKAALLDWIKCNSYNVPL